MNHRSFIAKYLKERGPYTEHTEGKYTVAIYEEGCKEWSVDGHFHREDGPAVESWDGTKEWWLNNELVFCDDFDDLENYPDVSEEFKKSIIRYKLKNM